MSSIILVILTLVSSFYQALFINEYTLGIYVPNIVLSLFIFSHHISNKYTHLITFFIIGLVLDSLNPIMFGTNTLSFMLLISLNNTLKAHFSLDLVVNRLLQIFAINLIYYGLYFINYAIRFEIDFISSLLFQLLGILINFVITLILFFIFDLIIHLKLDFNEN